eukprot:3455521-Prymnesium_polylepis.1
MHRRRDERSRDETPRAARAAWWGATRRRRPIDGDACCISTLRWGGRVAVPPVRSTRPDHGQTG